MLKTIAIAMNLKITPKDLQDIQLTCEKKYSIRQDMYTITAIFNNQTYGGVFYIDGPVLWQAHKEYENFFNLEYKKNLFRLCEIIQADQDPFTFAIKRINEQVARGELPCPEQLNAI